MLAIVGAVVIRKIVRLVRIQVIAANSEVQIGQIAGTCLQGFRQTDPDMDGLLRTSS